MTVYANLATGLITGVQTSTLTKYDQTYTRVDISAQVATLSDASAWATAFDMANNPDHAHLYDGVIQSGTMTTVVGTGDMTDDGLCALGADPGRWSEGAGTIVGANPNNVNDSVDAGSNAYDVGNESFVAVCLCKFDATWSANKSIFGTRDTAGGLEGWEVVTTGADGQLTFNTDDSGGTAKASSVSYNVRIPDEPIIIMVISNRNTNEHYIMLNLGDGAITTANAATLTSTRAFSIGAGRRQHWATGMTFVGTAIWLGANAEEVVDRSNIESAMDYFGIGWRHDREDLPVS